MATEAFLPDTSIVSITNDGDGQKRRATFDPSKAVGPAANDPFVSFLEKSRRDQTVAPKRQVSVKVKIRFSFPSSPQNPS
jgi:hypothetical protein